ncbi:hypothetical protein D9611_005355 [Ephemerocybe angulata]|uniref:BZIP domain-containing protein n=1 Tax=Ephemerocybe angulata TaxID=980116 RepID=A0A8H5FCX6_9AGAR|nr:hypothetical protein D9611_005355 [Tulosesus angulatus]
MQNDFGDQAFQQYAMNLNMNMSYAPTSVPAPNQYAMPSSSHQNQQSYEQIPSPSSLVHRRRRSGSSRRMSPDDLMPHDAPTQPRRYLTSSATSKKEIPSYYTKRPSYSRVSDEEEDELAGEEPLGPNATDQDKIEWKRRQNTLAARRSRKRKLMQQQQLEQAVEDLTREKEIWRTRALTLRQLLISHGILCPDFKD